MSHGKNKASELFDAIEARYKAPLTGAYRQLARAIAEAVTHEELPEGEPA